MTIKIFAIGAVAVLGSISAMASSFATIPSADAFVTTGPTGNLSNNNYGGAGGISVAAPGSPQGQFQSVLQFNLAPAAVAFDAEFGVGNWTVQSVSLQLTATSGGNPIYNIPGTGLIGISWMSNDTWIEGSGTPTAPAGSGISYNNLQSTFTSPGDDNLGSFNFTAATSGINVYSLALPSGFGADVAAGGAVSLHLFAADNSVSAVFNSRSFNTASARPVLTVQAVPEPSVLGLASMGAALWIIRCARASRRSPSKL